MIQVDNEALHLSRCMLGATLEHGHTLTAANQGALIFQCPLDAVKPVTLILEPLTQAIRVDIYQAPRHHWRLVVVHNLDPGHRTLWRWHSDLLHARAILLFALHQLIVVLGKELANGVKHIDFVVDRRLTCLLDVLNQVLDGSLHIEWEQAELLANTPHTPCSDYGCAIEALLRLKHEAKSLGERTLRCFPHSLLATVVEHSLHQLRESPAVVLGHDVEELVAIALAVFAGSDKRAVVLWQL